MTEEIRKKELIEDFKSANFSVPQDFEMPIIFMDPVAKIFNNPFEPFTCFQKSASQKEKEKFVEEAGKLKKYLKNLPKFDCVERCPAPYYFFKECKQENLISMYF